MKKHLTGESLAAALLSALAVHVRDSHEGELRIPGYGATDRRLMAEAWWESEDSDVLVIRAHRLPDPVRHDLN